MKEYDYNLDDNIAALATPLGESAIAMIRTTGPGAIDAVDAVFKGQKRLTDAKGYTLHFGSIVHPESGKVVDEVIAGVYRGPKSYTGQDSVELSCHGSLPGIQAILDALFKAGFRQANPGEFTFRAFLNGKMDLTQAEAVHEIISAKSNEAQDLALHRLGGAISDRINEAKDKLTHLMSAISIQLDYSDDEVPDEDISFDDLDAASEIVTELIDSYKTGAIFQHGINIALAGKTNAGKSSLFNLFLKEDRSIVSDIHGTTRDYLESWITISGIPVKLFDTAGLRDADHPIEAEGIKRSGRVIEGAALVIHVVDSTIGFDADDKQFWEQYAPSGKLIGVWNKTDLSDIPAPEGFLPVSASKGTGFHKLEAEILDRVLQGARFSGDKPVIDSLRQKNLLTRCLDALKAVRQGISDDMPMDVIALDMKDALDTLGEITGEVTSADILNTMFSNFCVGK